MNGMTSMNMNMNMQGVKRKSFSTACFLCQKANATCDEKHPCGRCILQKCAHMCFFSDEGTKRVANPGDSPVKELYPKETRRPPPHSNSDEILALLLTELREMREEQRRLHDDVRMLRAQQDKIELRLQNISLTNTANQGFNVGANGLGAHPLHNPYANPYSINHDHSHGYHPNGCPRCAQEEAIATPSPTTSSGLGNLGTHQQPQIQVLNQDPNFSALTTTGGLSGRAASVNGLVDIMEQLKNNSSSRQFGIPTGSAADTLDNVKLVSKSTPDSETLIVVFDLTTQPPTVFTATDNFCRMMGYEMHEVINMPWHKFIDPSNVHRTMNILNQAQLTTTLLVPQIYKTKDGHSFRTLDTHKIFYDDGKPVSDIVSISLSPSKVLMKEHAPSEGALVRRGSFDRARIYPYSPAPPSPTINSNGNSSEIPQPIEELPTPTNEIFYDNIPIVESIPTSPGFMYQPSTPAGSPHPAPFTIDPPPPSPVTTPSPTPPSPHIMNNNINTHAMNTMHQQPRPPSPPPPILPEFEGQMPMDEDEIMRILNTNEVRYPIEEWLAHTHLNK